jgi:hypothetical protein
MAGITGGYAIGRGRGVCASSGRTLVPGERCVVVLAERPESQDLVRVEFSGEAWDAGARADQKVGVDPAWVVGQFKSVVRSPEHKARVLVDDAELLELFQQLEGVEIRRRQGLRLVLALWLLRRRVLAMEGEERIAGGRVMTVRVRGSGTRDLPPALYRVVDPGFDEAATRDVMEELAGVMAGEAGPEAPTASEAGAQGGAQGVSAPGAGGKGEGAA